MRLIDAEELGEKIEEEFDGICAYDVSPDEAVNDFQDIVDSCKTIDAAPVVHGHWIREYHENDVYSIHFVCSNCKTCMETTRYERKCSLKFCPECGAKMDEGKEKDDESV